MRPATAATLPQRRHAARDVVTIPHAIAIDDDRLVRAAVGVAVLLDRGAHHRCRDRLEHRETPLLLRQHRRADTEKETAERAHEDQQNAAAPRIPFVRGGECAGAGRRRRLEREELADVLHDHTLRDHAARVVRRPWNTALIRKRRHDAVRAAALARRRFLERDIDDVAERDRLTLHPTESRLRDDEYALGLAERERLARRQCDHRHAAQANDGGKHQWKDPDLLDIRRHADPGDERGERDEERPERTQLHRGVANDQLRGSVGNDLHRSSGCGAMHTGSTLARVGGTVGWPPVQYSDC